MKPLDIRIVDLIEALNQAGIDPTQVSVKQLIEGLLAPKVTDEQVYSSELEEDPNPDNEWQIGDRVWFWDPLKKEIIKGTIHRLDYGLTFDTILIQQPDGSPHRWAGCKKENLHRDDGNLASQSADLLVTKHKNIGTSVVWDSDFWGRCSGTIVGYLKNPEEGSRAIIVEDDRQHAEWECDKYRLHFVSFLDYSRDGAIYPLD